MVVNLICLLEKTYNFTDVKTAQHRLELGWSIPHHNFSPWGMGKIGEMFLVYKRVIKIRFSLKLERRFFSFLDFLKSSTQLV